MYDASLLTQLDFNKTATRFNPSITAVDTGEQWLKVRPLQVGDFDRGFLQLLSQLTGIGDVSRMDFLSMHFHGLNRFNRTTFLTKTSVEYLSGNLHIFRSFP